MRSNMNVLGSAGLALMALVGVALSADAQTASSGLKATVAVRIAPTRQSDRPGGSAVSSDFLPGESKRLNLTAGRGDDLCDTGVWAIEPGVVASPTFQTRISAQEASALYIWHFEVSMREVATDRIVFDLFWERISRLTPNNPLMGKQRMTLREGQSHPIDLIHGEQNSDCLGVAVDVIAHIQDAPALQGKTLEWDLWFSGPQSAPVHRALTSPQGESAPFQFDPVATTITRTGGKGENATVHVYGQLRGRVRADGNIDVALTANRMVDSGQNPSRFPRFPNVLKTGNSGQKNFTVTPGEAVKIVLPPINPASPVQFRTDPVTGERTTTVASRTAQSAFAPAANEMSITVQARVR